MENFVWTHIYEAEARGIAPLHGLTMRVGY